MRIFLGLSISFLISISISSLHASQCHDELVARATQYRENPARVLANSMKRGLQFIRVDQRRIRSLAKKAVALNLEFAVPPWNWPPYLEQNQDFESVFDFFLTVNSINYKYFETGSEREFSDKGVHEALLTATRIAENWESLSANGFEKLRSADGANLRDHLFKAEIPMPMLHHRAMAFRELGNFLNDFRSGGHSWAGILKQIQNPAAVAYALPWVLPTWQDPFLKRSQLQMFMAVGRADAMGLNVFDPTATGELTVAADYMLPRILYAMGAIDYRDENSIGKIRNREPIESGTILEMELRAATILATESLVEALKKEGEQSASAPGVDAFLWTVATGNFPDRDMLRSIQEQMFLREMLPFHHTETTYY